MAITTIWGVPKPASHVKKWRRGAYFIPITFLQDKSILVLATGMVPRVEAIYDEPLCRGSPRALKVPEYRKGFAICFSGTLRASCPGHVPNVLLF